MNNASLLKHTQFRFMPLAGQMADNNVTIIGQRLACGYNLYVSTLSVEQSSSWLGRWSMCTLLDTSSYGTKERCSYFCTSPDNGTEIQVLKFPHTSDEYFWGVCHISRTGEYTEYFIKLSSIYLIKQRKQYFWTSIMLTYVISVYSDCSEIPIGRDGLYRISLPNRNSSLTVYCDEETNGGGWTVRIQRLA